MISSAFKVRVYDICQGFETMFVVFNLRLAVKVNLLMCYVGNGLDLGFYWSFSHLLIE